MRHPQGAPAGPTVPDEVATPGEGPVQSFREIEDGLGTSRVEGCDLEVGRHSDRPDELQKPRRQTEKRGPLTGFLRIPVRQAGVRAPCEEREAVPCGVEETQQRQDGPLRQYNGIDKPVDLRRRFPTLRTYRHPACGDVRKRAGVGTHRYCGDSTSRHPSGRAGYNRYRAYRGTAKNSVVCHMWK